MGIDAIPMRFVEAPASDLADDFLQLRNQGRMPDSTGGALNAINALLPEGATPLSKEDVYVHFLEAANSNFIGDRFMYLGTTTLKNIASEAGTGIAFMNSHRTGGLSAPAELPFGKTFAGQFQSGLDGEGDPKQRTVVGAYMLRGIHPNGTGGPSTDDLNRMITGGVVADVSVGLSGGNRICNVCNNDLFGEDEDGHYLCPHVPGTHYEMDEKAIAAEQERDARNKDGYATFTLEDSHFSEVSPVYDGAVPGAGVKKVLSLAVESDLDNQHLNNLLNEATRLYSDYLPEKFQRRAVPNQNTRHKLGGSKMSFKDTVAQWFGAGMPDDFDAGGGHQPTVIPDGGQGVPPSGGSGVKSAREVELEAQLAQERAERHKAQASEFSRKHTAKFAPCANHEGALEAKLADLYTFAAQHGKESDLAAIMDELPAAGSVLTNGVLPQSFLEGAAPVATNPAPPVQDAKQMASSIVAAGQGKMTQNGSAK